MAIRRFQYRDDATIDDYLGSIELGVPDDEIRREDATRSGRAGVTFGGLGVGGERGSTTGVERNIRQNAASKFEALFRLLREREPKELWELDGLDDETWHCLGRGSLINIEVSISVPSLARALGIASSLGPLAQAMREFGAQVEPEVMTQMTALTQFAAAGGTQSLSVGAETLTSPRYSFVCKMVQTSLLVPFEAIEGTRYMFGQIEELIPSGVRELAVDMAGLGLLNREQRRAMAQSNNSEIQGAFVEGPGAVVHVIALYN